jgi:nucleoside-specific outer membrane channel protein Tsx
MAANWSDTFVGYRHGSAFREPGLLGTQTKDIVQLQHASGWDYGTNFFNLDMQFNNANDPSRTRDGMGQPQGGVTGSNDAYATFRSALSLGKVFRTDLGFGPVRDLSFTAGFDFNVKNNDMAPRRRMIVAGPTLNFALPNHGFMDLGIWACHAQDYNGITQRAVDGKVASLVSLTWSAPFSMGMVPARFKGFLTRTGPMGKDGFGEDIQPETLSNASLMVDISGLFGRKPGAAFLGAGYEYWNNKYGLANRASEVAAFNNRRTSAPMVQVEFHF